MSPEPSPRGLPRAARPSYLHAVLSHGGRCTPGRARVRVPQGWVAPARLRLPRAPLSVSFLREAGDPAGTPPRPGGCASARAPRGAPGAVLPTSARASPRPAQQRGRAGDAARGLCSRSHVPTLRGVRVFTSPVGAGPHRADAGLGAPTLLLLRGTRSFLGPRGSFALLRGSHPCRISFPSSLQSQFPPL